MKFFYLRDTFSYKKWFEYYRGNFEIVVFISLLIYTSALCLSKAWLPYPGATDGSGAEIYVLVVMIESCHRFNFSDDKIFNFPSD